MEAVEAICSLVSTSLAMASSSAATFSTAVSMPRFRAIGLAPAATLRRPSRTRAWASTVAVVVPSPATSSVFLATSLTSSAPIFSYGSSSSISLAIETPSLVMVGAPHFFSSTTLRPARAERHLDGVGELVHAPLETAAGLLVERDDLAPFRYSPPTSVDMPGRADARDGRGGMPLSPVRLDPVALSVRECQVPCLALSPSECKPHGTTRGAGPGAGPPLGVGANCITVVRVALRLLPDQDWIARTMSACGPF